MKELKFKDTEKEQWLYTRRGKITGSRLKDIIVKRGTGRKIGFYELVAEKLGLPPEADETALERGVRLETEALERFEKESGKKVDKSLILWAREDNENIAVSPDGIIGKTEAVEVKCLSSARHIEALIEKKVPADYEYQALQYFIVNDKLKTLHFVFYDPRFAPLGKNLDYFEIEIKRAEMEEQIKETLEYERKVMEEVDQIVNQLTF